MVSRATNNSSHAANAEKSKGAGRRTHEKGSRVTQAGAKAQRTKLDAQAKAWHIQEEQETLMHTTQKKKTVRQETQTKRHLIETLIEAYIQDHIGGNHSEKRVE